MNTTYPDGIHSDLLAVLTARKIAPDRVSTHASDVYIGCATHAEAAEIRAAGTWRSMATVCRMNPEHPDAKATPWLADIPFARLGYLVSQKCSAA